MQIIGHLTACHTYTTLVNAYNHHKWLMILVSQEHFGGSLTSLAFAYIVKDFHPGNNIGLENRWNNMSFMCIMEFYAFWDHPS